jgi:hypothetical protein
MQNYKMGCAKINYQKCNYQVTGASRTTPLANDPG